MGYLDDLVNKFNNTLNESGVVDAIDGFDSYAQSLTEAEYTKATRHLKMEVLDVDKFVRVNECKRITNPVFYSGDNVPTDDGLLSNTIFGITKNDRAGIFAYIDLEGYYIDPSCYKCWCKIDSNIKAIVHKTDTFSIAPNGNIVQDPNGKNGIKFLKQNIDNIKFRHTESNKRDLRINYLEKNRKSMFISKYLVIPPYYRDTNTGKRSVGVGGINKLYSQLINSVSSLRTAQDYGFDLSGAMEGRVQESLLCIYDWACGNTNESIKTDVGIGLGGKMGIIRRANTSKTSNYAARLVISAPELKVNSPTDLMVDFDHSAVPLAACIACFKPYIQFYVKRFFENEFIGTEQYPVRSKTGEIIYEIPKDPLIEFSDARIKMEMDRFIAGVNNRFSRIPVPVESGKTVYMRFKGRFDQTVDSDVLHRALTWCDIFYIAACDAVRDKMILITRYPVDTKFNQIATHINISSTIQTEPIYFGDTYYKFYPKIRKDEIEQNTGNKFVDTMKLSNLYLDGLGADYDGDTVSIKGVFTEEANKELSEFVNNKANFIDVGGKNIRTNGKDVIQSLYEVTKVLPSDANRIIDPIFS